MSLAGIASCAPPSIRHQRIVGPPWGSSCRLNTTNPCASAATLPHPPSPMYKLLHHLYQYQHAARQLSNISYVLRLRQTSLSRNQDRAWERIKMSRTNPPTATAMLAMSDCRRDRTYYRRKFRSQISNNMDRWQGRGGKSQRRERKNKQGQRRERVRRTKKLQVREKVEKSQNTVFLVTPEGRKVGALMRRARSHLERWELKRIKMRKTHQVRSTFDSWDVPKVHPPCGAKHISKSKCAKHLSSRTFLEVAMLKNCTTLWREAHLEAKMVKMPHGRSTFGRWALQKVYAATAWNCTKQISKWKRWKHQTYPNVQTTFGSCDVQKVHAVVAWSTFQSQNVKSTASSDNFWTFNRTTLHSNYNCSTNTNNYSYNYGQHLCYARNSFGMIVRNLIFADPYRMLWPSTLLRCYNMMSLTSLRAGRDWWPSAEFRLSHNRCFQHFLDKP